MPSPESLFKGFTLALEAAADAGDRQGYHSIETTFDLLITALYA